MKGAIAVQFDPQKTIFVIDGSSFLYRAYYGLRPLHTAKGEPVQAVYSFCRMIKKIMNMFTPGFMVLVWDSKGPTTRHTMYSEYKATRQAPPSDLFEQKKYIVQFADMIGLKQITKEGVEADDVMYSIAQEHKKDGFTTVFITSDKDMSQALDLQTVIYDPFKEEFVDAPAFKERMGFEYTKLPFYFALLGDASDNIPGVSGIGKKGALDLVTQFASLRDLYENLDKVSKPRTRQLLQEQKDNAFLSEQLFLLQYHPSHLNLQDMSFDTRNWHNARSLFAELNFVSLIKDMAKEAPAIKAPGQTVARLQQYTFKAITTEQELDELCYAIRSKKAVAIDTETDGLDSLQAHLVGISFCVEQGTAYYVPVAHKVSEPQLPLATVIEKIKPILQDASIAKYFHNAKWDQEVLWQHGITVTGVAFDTMIASVLVLRDWQRASLKDLSVYYFDEPMLSFQEVVKDNKYNDFSYVPLQLATEYAAADAHQTFKLKTAVQESLKTEKMLSIYEQLDGPLIQVLFKMEVEGIHLDTQLLSELDKKVIVELKKIEQSIIDVVGQDKKINLNSPKQVEQLLFVELGLPPKRKSAKGSYSTDQSVLEELSLLHPVPGLILKYRELFKLKSTYIDALPTYINPKTGNIHTTFNQTATATGRLASYDPNLQNIPVSGYGVAVREAFKPQQGYLFLSADYSQIELRVLAHLSGDKHLTEAFLSGHDIHAETAARLFDVPLDQVTTDQRQLGKRINFSILYGLTPYGLSQDLKIPFKDAKIYIEKYFEQYPGVQEWMDRVVEETKHKGYVTTHWGKRRYVPGIYERNKSLYEEAKRVAINTVAQGTAAEIMKFGMINLDAAFQKESIDAKILLQIHDELLICVSELHKNQAEQLVKNVLESVVQWHVPLIVNTRFGKNWREVSK